MMRTKFFKLYDYQRRNAEKLVEILREYGLAYFAAEVRTGKTATALAVAQRLQRQNVLFITKKKAISSIEDDYKNFGFTFDLVVINYESAHKVIGEFDFIIVDEAHSLGAYPKPSARTKKLKELCKCQHILFLSGTPTPESYSQIFHQLFISSYTPFKEPTFYKWAANYVNIKQREINGFKVNDYSDANINKIQQVIGGRMLSFTQQEAGFKTFVDEHILTVPMKPTTYAIIEKLKKDKVIESKNGNGVILADTKVKELSKVHQLCSGTIKNEDGDYIIIDESKAQFIADYFKGKKIAIFYKFHAEYLILKKYFDLADNPREFNESPDKTFAAQFVSGREGVRLDTASALIFFNLDFSALSYLQARARLQTKDREKAAPLYWIFSDKGIEKQIYKTVKNKEDFTTKHYDRAEDTKEDNRQTNQTRLFGN
jgi:hypothetical protein